MRPWLCRGLSVLGTILLAGCGGQKSGTSADSAKPAGTVSAYDSGPRAIETPADETQAKLGEEMFKGKGCSACHGFGRRISGPDLQGVTTRRTTAWLENQILHPEKMIREDPIARQLFAEYALQMPNQGVTESEADAIIEYLRYRDQEEQRESHEEEESQE